jgi:hypothetical protein
MRTLLEESLHDEAEGARQSCMVQADALAQYRKQWRMHVRPGNENHPQ